MNQERLLKIILSPHVSEKARLRWKSVMNMYFRLLILQPNLK